jgi:hypothetical protein
MAMKDDFDIDIDIDIDIDLGESEKPNVPENIEADAKGQLSETHKIAKKKRHQYEDRMKFEGDMDYFFTVVFRSKKERNEFLESRGINLLDDTSFVFYDDVKSFL